MRSRLLRVAALGSLLIGLAAAFGCSSNAATVTAGTATAAPQPLSRPSSETTAPPAASVAPSAPTTFAVIGDYGTDNSRERTVAELVDSWDPAYVIALGDDYYSPAGGTGTGRYDESTGKYYGRWLKDIRTTGHHYPVGTAERNAFFPALGNHDYSDATPSPKTYLTYFNLPGRGFANTSDNERYYDFVQGPIHFFVLNSNAQERDGRSRFSKQARWLKAQLERSTSRWNIVYDHHPPYSSDAVHGSTSFMQWPFARWGADVVLSGHSHTYERIERDGIVYFVNGLGGAKRYTFHTPVKGSKKRYRAGLGAQRVTVAEDAIEFRFYNAGGALVDRYRVVAQ